MEFMYHNHRDDSKELDGMNKNNTLLRECMGRVDMFVLNEYHTSNNTRHASPRCAPGGFLISGGGNGLS